MKQDNDMRQADGAGNGQSGRLSYKFQRLREQLRMAILNGEFQDRLPGERELGRMYHANAKTINKALSDLSNEGLVVRHIGRGTFVAIGDSAECTRRSTYSCFRLSRSIAETEQRSLVAALRAEQGSRGHQVRELAVEGSREGAIGLTDWPSAQRRQTDGLFFIPDSPLGRLTGRVDDRLILEAHRRRVPVVVLGACASMAKMNAVVPDFVDAGYRLAEHAFRLGCDKVVALHVNSGREVGAVLSGCRTAAMRYRGELVEFQLYLEQLDATQTLDAFVTSSVSSADPGRQTPTVGVVFIGTETLSTIHRCSSLSAGREQGSVVLSCVAGSGDPTPREMGITAYEVDPAQIVSSGARLMEETNPGQRPVEIVIPGRLVVRAGTGQSEKILARAEQELAEIAL